MTANASFHVCFPCGFCMLPIEPKFLGCKCCKWTRVVVVTTIECGWQSVDILPPRRVPNMFKMVDACNISGSLPIDLKHIQVDL